MNGRPNRAAPGRISLGPFIHPLRFIGLFAVCLVTGSNAHGQGLVTSGGGIGCSRSAPAWVEERNWTFHIGATPLGLVQVRQALATNGARLYLICDHPPEEAKAYHLPGLPPRPNFRWQRSTTIYLGFTQFTTRCPAWLVATLANALPFALAVTFCIWRRSQRGQRR